MIVRRRSVRRGVYHPWPSQACDSDCDQDRGDYPPESRRGPPEKEEYNRCGAECSDCISKMKSCSVEPRVWIVGGRSAGRPGGVSGAVQIEDADDDKGASHTPSSEGTNAAHVSRLTVKLNGRPEAPDERRGRRLSSSARGAQPPTHHGPFQRLLGDVMGVCPACCLDHI